MRFPVSSPRPVLPSDLSALLLSAVTGGMLLLGVLWLFYDRRDRRFLDQSRRKTTFCCLKCSHVYTSAETDLCPCPRCGHSNAPLRF